MIFAFILFPFIVLAFFDFSLLRTHFWPFTEVVRKIRREGYAERCGNALNPLGQRGRGA
jgi:hypothetical protein